jgi:hypothetical protein
LALSEGSPDIAVLNVDALAAANVGHADGNVLCGGLRLDHAAWRENACEKQAGENARCARVGGGKIDCIDISRICAGTLLC